MKRTITVFSAIALLIIAAQSHGSVVIYPDRATFEAAIPGLIVEGFEQPIVSAPSVSFPGFTVSADQGNIMAIRESRYVSEGKQALTDSQALTAATFTFDTPIRAFGLDINDFGGSGSGNLTVVTDTGSIDLVLATVPPPLPVGMTIFFGFTDTEGFTSITFDRTTAGDRPGYDHLVFQQSIPEPSSMVLALASLVSLVSLARRRRR